MKKESGLECLKKDYAKLQKKYSIPSFEELNRDFDIEKIAERETDFILREVRRTMGDKVGIFLRFLETLMNPSNAPMFIFTLVKNLKPEDKQVIESLYKKFVEIEIILMERDTVYDEKQEAEAIRKIYSDWDFVRKRMLAILNSFKNGSDDSVKKKDRGYFG